MNSTGLGPHVNAARVNMLINAVDTESKAFLSNLTMMSNGGVGEWLTVRKTELKFKMTLMSSKGKREQTSIESLQNNSLKRWGKQRQAEIWEQ